MKQKLATSVILFLGICCACSEKSHIAEPLPEITVVTASSGVGDNGYNDQILSGVMAVNESEDIVLSLITPGSVEEAGNVLEEWCSQKASGKRSLLVLASNEYERLVDGMGKELPSDKQILLFESETGVQSENVSSFIIRRYGVSYLAGCMAGEAESAYIIAAMDSETYVGDAAEGFTDGYRSCGKEAEVIYLAEDEMGYSMPGQAYKTMQEIDYNAFVYPLAGGSNNGMYKSTREQEFCLQLIAGMDVDCSQYSSRVPFSVVFDIRHIVISLLEEWLSGAELKMRYVFDMSDEDVVSVVVNPDFYQDMIAWEEWYDRQDYWSEVCERFKDVAKEKEEAYYEDR